MTGNVSRIPAPNGSLYLDHFNFRSLRSFVTVAECGGFRRAASRLKITQPAISLQIKQLEQSIRMRLFSRGNRVQLTAEGQLLYNYALQLLSLNDAMIAALRSHHQYSANGDSFPVTATDELQKRSRLPGTT